MDIITAAVVATLIWIPLVVALAVWAAVKSYRVVPDYQRLAIQRLGERKILGPGLVFVFDWTPFIQVDQVSPLVDLRLKEIPLFPKGEKVEFVSGIPAAQPGQLIALGQPAAGAISAGVQMRAFVQVMPDGVEMAAFVWKDWEAFVAAAIESAFRSMASTTSYEDAEKLRGDIWLVLEPAVSPKLVITGTQTPAVNTVHVFLDDLVPPTEYTVQRQEVEQTELAITRAEREAQRMQILTTDLHAKMVAALIVGPNAASAAEAHRFAYEYVTRQIGVKDGKIVDIRSQTADIATILAGAAAAWQAVQQGGRQGP